MATKSSKFITVHINRAKLQQTVIVLPTIFIVLSAFLWSISDSLEVNTLKSPDAVANNAAANGEDAFIASNAPSYPLSANELNINLFSLQLPPPSLDAMPYDVRSPLSNGTSVPVKKRWLWVPDGKQMQVMPAEDGSLSLHVPEGTLLWKEFYIETDRGTYLIERRITARVPKTQRNPEGWAFYSAHHLPEGGINDLLMTLDSTSDAAAEYMFQPHEWLPTQSETVSIEVRFQDARGVEYPYLFPGEIQCLACHGGSAGAFPNADNDPIFAFALHPNNLTPESFIALVSRGWMTNGELLLTENYLEPQAETGEKVSFDILTNQLVGVLRNNCASCHTNSVYAAASSTGFIIDPNYPYTSDELIALLQVSGKTMENSHLILSPGKLEESELWLRVNGLNDRRRMPPAEGGLPDVDPRVIDLIEAWIIQSAEQ